MEIMHSSHPDHPLILNKEVHKNESCNEVVCYGCQIPITDCDDDDSAAYECAICKLFLHKRCAEAPAKITHPMHSQHPLTLLSHPPYSSLSCICNVCCQSWKWFTYHCSHCQFDIDIICALKEDRRFEHKSHEHPLTVQLRQVLLHCDACGTESRDYSCLCTTCPFWIHKTCASLPSIINHSKHNHPLNLAYSLPDMFRSFEFYCDICHKIVHPIYWLYYCGNCRYFVHLKCASTSNAAPEPLLQRDDEDEDQNLDLVMRFPIPADKSADLMSQFVKKISLGDVDFVGDLISQFVKKISLGDVDFEGDLMSQFVKKIILGDVDFERDLRSQFVKKISLGDADCEGEGEITIDHWSHGDHPLILWDGQSKNELNTNIVYDGMVCAACMQPITAPFYHCSDCNYFLHRYCAVLPLELQHTGHPDHPLKINYPIKYLLYFSCTCCRMASSGFCFSCEICNVKIDIGCATLPTKIVHESHEHPLVTRQVSDFRCNACNSRYSGIGIAYTCETCSYILDFRCATLPRTLTHDYDKHPIPLTYPPIKDHPSEFYCEICEEEIHPKFWLYYCHECSYSFHVECIRPLDLYSNVKFGKILKVWDHQHPLTFVRNGDNKSPCPCAMCGKDKKGHPILECGECGFKICILCWNELYF